LPSPDTVLQGPSALTPNRNSMVNGVRARPDEISSTLADCTLQHEATPDISRAYDSPGETDVASSAAPPGYESDIKNESPPHEPALSTISTATSTATTAVTSGAQKKWDDWKDQSAKAKAQIAATTESDSLRQRNVKAMDGEKQPAEQLAMAVRQGVEGVPVPIVAMLCFLSFLLAYIFF
jgi:hypothetical protein